METFSHRRPNAKEVLYRAVVSKAYDEERGRIDKEEPRRRKKTSRRDIDVVHEFYKQRRCRTSTSGTSDADDTATTTETSPFSMYKDLPSVLPTCIPQTEHIVQMSWEKPAPAIWERYRVVYEESERKWKTTLFPAVRPTSTADVQMLDQWLSDKIATQLGHPSPAASETLSELQVTFDQAVHELARQLSLHSVEAGELLIRVWQSNAELIRTKEKQLLRDAAHWKIEMEQMLHDVHQHNQKVDDSLSRIIVERMNAATRGEKQAKEEFIAMKRQLDEAMTQNELLTKKNATLQAEIQLVQQQRDICMTRMSREK